jgi:hypothetical protein
VGYFACAPRPVSNSIFQSPAEIAFKLERKRVDTTSPCEVLGREILKGFCLGLALAVGIPLICGIIWPKPVPSLDVNTQAYILILNGIKEGRYSSAKELFDQAYSMTDDSELRYLADFFSKTCQLALNSGIDTHEEGNSLAGGVKAFIRGFTAPLDSLSAWSLLAKECLGDFDKDCTDVDNS